MSFRRYAVRRVAAALTPIPHLQRAPLSGPVEPIDLYTADGVRIRASLLRRGRERLAIICHGFAASQQALGIVWMADMLDDRYDVLTFDWRGYGASDGLASFGGAEALDLAAVLGAARDLGYSKVAVVAESMGALIAISTLGAESADPVFPQPDALISVSAPADYAFTAGLRPHLVKYVAPVSWLRPIAPLIGFRLGEVRLPRPLDVIANIRIPLLLVHGDRDRTVPVHNAHLLHERAPGATLRIYPGIDHALLGMKFGAARPFLEDVRALLDAM